MSINSVFTRACLFYAWPTGRRSDWPPGNTVTPIIFQEGFELVSHPPVHISRASLGCGVSSVQSAYPLQALMTSPPTVFLLFLLLCFCSPVQGSVSEAPSLTDLRARSEECLRDCENYWKFVDDPEEAADSVKAAQDGIAWIDSLLQESRDTVGALSGMAHQIEEKELKEIQEHHRTAQASLQHIKTEYLKLVDRQPQKEPAGSLAPKAAPSDQQLADELLQREAQFIDCVEEFEGALGDPASSVQGIRERFGLLTSLTSEHLQMVRDALKEYKSLEALVDRLTGDYEGALERCAYWTHSCSSAAKDWGQGEVFRDRYKSVDSTTSQSSDGLSSLASSLDGATDLADGEDCNNHTEYS